MTKPYIDILEIFEDLYRANMRASVFELEQCMQSIELLPRTQSKNAIMVQETLRHFILQSITTLEERLAALRTRYEALPELPAKKEVDDAS